MTGACATSASAAEIDLRGRTVTVLVAFEAGGPYDLYGRLLARHLSAHLPGNPSIVVQNLAGAGGLNGINQLYNVAPKDGTTVGIVSQTVALGQALGVTPGIKYDVKGLTWLGRINSNVEMQHSYTKSGFTSFDVARQREVIVAGTGPTSSSFIFPKLLNETIGTKFKVVTGYPGPQSAQLAMQRGEVAAIVKPWSSIKATEAEALRTGEISLIMQYTRERHRELPNVPAVVDVAQTAEQRELLGLFAAGSALGTSIAAPPGLEPAMADMWRKALAETLASQELRKDAAQAGMDIDPLNGEAVTKLVGDTFLISPQTLERARSFAQAMLK
jgi:tripartite-type tricarboxylate transporter receptor subunit TctC